MIYIDNQRDTDNCGMDEWFGFYEDEAHKTGEKTFRDVSYFHAIHSLIGSYKLSAIILFSGNDLQRNYAFSPQVFAEWLKKKGETVVQTAPALNSNSGRMIEAFLWTPSDDFQGMLNEYRDRRAKLLEKRS
jgi:hypothetical protein